MIRITPDISIDESELDIRFVLAGGPGGQNVNKVATAAQLRFDVRNSPSLHEDVKRRVASLAGRRMTDAGELIIDARRFRSQARNREDAVRRLVELIAAAAAPPKRRRPTRPTAASKQRRLDSKTRQSQKKRQRRTLE